MRVFRYAILVAMLLVAGCQSTPQGPLPTNQFVFDASKQKTKEAIVSIFISRGYQITRDTDFLLVLDKPASDNAAAQFLYGSEWNGTPNARVVFTITGDAPTTVQSSIQIVTNPGTGMERITDMNQNADARTRIAGAMDQVAALLKPPAK